MLKLHTLNGRNHGILEWYYVEILPFLVPLIFGKIGIEVEAVGAERVEFLCGWDSLAPKFK